MSGVTTTRSRDEPGTEPDRLRRCVLFEVVRSGSPPGGARRIPIADVDAIAIGRGTDHAIDGRRLVVGVDDNRASSRHVEIVRRLGVWILHDRGSKNGTFVGGRRVTERALSDGDVIEVGHTFFVWRADVACGTEIVRRSIDDAPAGLATVDPDLERTFDRLHGVTRGGPVLITGESGTGKELLARAIQERLGRPGPLVAVDCGAMAPSIAAAELFGSRRGAFSGAEDRRGLIRSADGGTLFLDEIGNLPEAVQVMLLRVLETGEVRAIGATDVDRVDVKIVAATNLDLHHAAADGRFRFDLLQRLAGQEFALPPIRARRADLGLIVAGIARSLALPALTFDLGAVRALFERPWTGNVRELRRAIETSLARTDDHLVRGSELPDVPGTPVPTPEPTLSRDQLDVLLAEHRGNLAAVARALRTSRSQIHRLIERFGIDVSVFRDGAH